MIKIDSQRSLLLEQLESRCMLAGGIFSQSSDHHEHRNQDSRQRDRSSEVRTERGDSQRHDRSDDGQRDGNQRHRGHGDRGGHSNVDPPNHQNHRPSESQAVPVLLAATQSPPSPPPVQVIVVIGNENPGRNSNTASRPEDTLERPAQSQQFQPVSSPQGTGIPVVEEVSESADANAKTLVSEHVDETQANEPVVENHSPDRIEINVVENVDDVVSNSPAEVVQPSKAEAGVVDLAPLTRSRLQASSEDIEEAEKAEAPWQINAGSLNRLRDVVNEAETRVSDKIRRAADAAFASWFNQPTGLIEIEALGRLQTPVDHVDALIRVVLDTSVGLHRSIDLLAVSAQSHPLDADNLRDAILAVIDAEATPVGTEALGGNKTVRYSAISLPAVAVAATGLNLLAKRGRRKVKMEKTNPS